MAPRGVSTRTQGWGEPRGCSGRSPHPPGPCIVPMCWPQGVPHLPGEPLCLQDVFLEGASHAWSNPGVSTGRRPPCKVTARTRQEAACPGLPHTRQACRTDREQLGRGKALSGETTPGGTRLGGKASGLPLEPHGYHVLSARPPPPEARPHQPGARRHLRPLRIPQSCCPAGGISRQTFGWWRVLDVWVVC